MLVKKVQLFEFTVIQDLQKAINLFLQNISSVLVNEIEIYPNYENRAHVGKIVYCEEHTKKEEKNG